MVVFFESGWGILSAIGIANVLYGLTIISITSFSPVILLLIIVSTAGSLANALCYFAFYTDASPVSSAAASGSADILWMIQEVGISLYGYIILMHVLSHRTRLVFMGLFWSIVLGIFIIRIFILLGRLRIILQGDTDYQAMVNRLHTGYFTMIAVLECTCAFFLLRKFASARNTSREAQLNVSFLQHLMRGTEIRVASLCLIGISRAVTYFFQPSIAEVSTVASQIDRFIYTLETAFPIMLYIDILASRIKFASKDPMDIPQLELFRTPQGEGYNPPSSVWNDGVDQEGVVGSNKSHRRGSLAEQSLVSRPQPARMQSPDNSGILKTVEIDVYDSRTQLIN